MWRIELRAFPFLVGSRRLLPRRSDSFPLPSDDFLRSTWIHFYTPTRASLARITICSQALPARPLSLADRIYHSDRGDFHHFLERDSSSESDVDDRP